MNAIPWFEFPYWSMNDFGDIPEKGHFDGALAVVDGIFYEFCNLCRLKNMMTASHYNKLSIFNARFESNRFYHSHSYNSYWA